jgi:hypothetical protein
MNVVERASRPLKPIVDAFARCLEIEPAKNTHRVVEPLELRGMKRAVEGRMNAWAHEKGGLQCLNISFCPSPNRSGNWRQ